ncbi:MFS family permease [Silvibacterium bohemicum]|uniref:MFS family permease n=1 Tax=Silvibacterium bohemicum TaxID=1577686 RepID=A0A841K790_9BACT|nr:MFS transporter [Silvibacterium bohemicum]MBB6146991.1 MFS family permease [Silvibacterium bohemicum]
MAQSIPGNTSSSASSHKLQNSLLLLVAGLGGLLYGVDVGIIGGALPYLEATSGLSAGQLSIIVAAVLLGSVFSTLFAGLLADWMGRKPLMTISGITFVLSIPVIALSHGYGPLFFGRLLQGISGGLIGVVVPLYLAECLTSSVRGKGTGIFQWLLTLGIVSAALIGIYYSYRVEEIAHAASASALFHFKDQAWRRIFWVSLPPGLLFVIGSLMVSESPRWLFRRGKIEAARLALLRSRTAEEAESELKEMQETASAALSSSGKKIRESLLQRKYVFPFLLTCVILFCNTATGINSVIGYNTSILLQSGLSDLHAHWGYVLFTAVNFLATIFGMTLVDKKGRKFLLVMGTSGVILSMLCTGILFLRTEKQNVDCRSAIQSLVSPDQTLDLRFTPDTARQMLGEGQSQSIGSSDVSLVVIYSYGGFTGATSFVRADDASAAPIHVTREIGLPSNKIEAFFANPFADLNAAQTAPLKIQRAVVGRVPNAAHGWLVAIFLYIFVGFYAAGPGVCVWIALSELMPTRIRSNGMSIALVLNQLVSTTLAVIFLPVASKYGYSAMFFLFAGFTVIYFLTALLFLPETKGKTLEEIEEHFAKAGAR